MPAKRNAQHPKKWKKGVSGNPAGRPLGSRHKTTLAVEALLDGEAEGLTRKAVDMAMAGDTTALRLCIERVAPVRKGRPVKIDFGPLDGSSGLAGAMSAIIASMGRGELSPEEAQSMAGVIDAAGAAYERRELEKRIEALESGKDEP